MIQTVQNVSEKNEFDRKKIRIYRDLYTNAISFDNVYSKLQATRALSSSSGRKMSTRCRARISYHNEVYKLIKRPFRYLIVKSCTDCDQRYIRYSRLCVCVESIYEFLLTYDKHILLAILDC